ncbi:membrane protein [Litchfieldella qijiaojingensis]|uniref:Membrane protein n=1 Tax=Litchfieldella qijiaojingensis TaxID=980347 RepID=A0ABQ2ZB36_9GAMM|nr:membrane protein [Halomonas qijiaojingensis]
MWALQRLAERLISRIRPYMWVWPPVAFSAGVASFFLVDRQQWLGGALALGMLLAWVLLLSESLIGRFLARRGYSTLPRGVTTFIAQMIHQETLFFCLPFLLATTVWTSGQALFTLLIVALALLSILDPLYFKLADRYRWVYFAFHAQCVFVVVLVTLPLMLQLTTSESLRYAVVLMVIFSLPSLLHLVRPQQFKGWMTMFGLLALLASLAWVGRAWVPPANLWINGSALSPGLDTATRTPQGSVRLQTDALRRSGLYAYTAIRAPRGLREEVYHEWRHEGELMDRIPLVIHGGREDGYRAWTHKRNFPKESAGRWRIDIMTTSGQRIGVMRFTVTDKPSAALVADGSISPPPGVPGLDIRRLVPGNYPHQP